MKTFSLPFKERAILENMSVSCGPGVDWSVCPSMWVVMTESCQVRLALTYRHSASHFNIQQTNKQHKNTTLHYTTQYNTTQQPVLNWRENEHLTKILLSVSTDRSSLFDDKSLIRPWRTFVRFVRILISGDIKYLIPSVSLRRISVNRLGHWNAFVFIIERICSEKSDVQVDGLVRRLTKRYLLPPSGLQLTVLLPPGLVEVGRTSQYCDGR